MRVDGRVDRHSEWQAGRSIRNFWMLTIAAAFLQRSAGWLAGWLYIQ